MDGTRFIISILLVICVYHVSADFFPERNEDLFPPGHERIRRFITIMSKKHPEADPYLGLQWQRHVWNLLRGGTADVEIKMPTVERILKYIPLLKRLLKKKKVESKEDMTDFQMEDMTDFQMEDMRDFLMENMGDANRNANNQADEDNEPIINP